MAETSDTTLGGQFLNMLGQKGAQVRTSDQEEPDEGTEGGAGDGDEPVDSRPAPAAGEDMKAFAARVAEQMAQRAPQRWEDEAMTKLVAQGWPEGTARQMVNQGGRKNVERILAGGGDTGNLAPVEPSAALAGVDLGAELAELLEGGGEDGKTAKALSAKLSQLIERASEAKVAPALAQLQQLQQMVQASSSDALVPRLVAAREELSGLYPELRDQAAWDAITPKVLGAIEARFATDPVEALKIAAVTTYGARVPGQSAPNPMDPNHPNPTAAGQPTPGARAMDAAGAKKRIAQMIFEGRSEEEVRSVRKQYERQLGVQLGSRDD